MALKIPTLAPTVEQAQLPNVKMANTVDPNAFGAGAAQQGIRALGQLGQANREVEHTGQLIMRRAEELQAEADHSAVLDASSKYLTEANAYIRGAQSKLGNDATGTAAKGEKDLAALTEKHAGSLKNRRQLEAFKRFTLSHNEALANQLYHHETVQNREALLLNSSATIDGLVRGAVGDDTPGAIAALRVNVTDIVAKAYPGQSKAVIDNAVFKSMNHFYIEKAKSIALQDPAAALTFLAANKKNLDPTAYAALVEPLMNKVNTNNDVLLARDAVTKLGLEGALKANQEGKLGGTGLVSYTQFKASMFGQESSSNWNVNPNGRTGALGGFQILPENWTKWAAEVLGDPNAALTPENQNKVVDAKLKPLFDKYGAEGAAVAWYAGEQNAKRWAAGMTTAIGDDGREYSWDAKQGAGDEPSVREYVQKVAGGASTERMLEREAAILAEGRKQQGLKALREHETLNDVKNFMAINSTDQLAQLAYIRNSALEPYVKKAMTDALTKITESDVGARVMLNQLAVADKLTAQDVTNMALKGLLTTEHQVHYYTEAAKIASGTQDKATQTTDKKWMELADLEGPYIGNKAKNQLFVVELKDRLDAEGVKGYDRYDRALALMKQEKDENGKRFTAYFTQYNNAERQQLVQAYDEGIISRAELGFKRTGRWDRSYGQISAFLAEIGEHTKTDPRAADAWELLVKSGRVINPVTWREAYDTVAGARGYR